MNENKRISFMGKNQKLLHIETPLGIVNIRINLHDLKGRPVNSIEVIPSNTQGDPKIKLSGYGNTRLIQLRGVKA